MGVAVVSMVTWDIHLREVLGGSGIAVRHPSVSFNPVRTKASSKTDTATRIILPDWMICPKKLG